MDKIKVLSVFGTRPEAIKMAVLIKKLQASPYIISKLCVTGQHREMLDQVLYTFDIIPDYDLNIMKHLQSIEQITTDILNNLTNVIKDFTPDIILVHGDTTTTFSASLCAFYNRISLGHVEAGLRTYDKYKPYPEDINRRLTAVLSDLHFAPTNTAKNNLLSENIKESGIFVTGNTAIDAMGLLVSSNYSFKEDVLNRLDYSKKTILLTAHRRESYQEDNGIALKNICNSIIKLTQIFKDIQIVYPVHYSPFVRNIVYDILGNNTSIYLVSPLTIQDMHNLIAKSYIIMTDSGGLQEEAPHLNKPAIVLRSVTERPEGVAAGCLVLAGTNTDNIYNIAANLLTDNMLYNKMATAKNPFGDGVASERILQAILYHFGKSNIKPNDFE